MEREAFLSTVRTAVGRTRFPSQVESAPGGSVADPIADDLMDLFRSQLEAVDGVVHVDDSPLEVIGEVARIHGARTCLAWDLELLGLEPETLTRLGIERLETSFDPAARLSTQTPYLGVDLGITGAEAGFAESGSIVVRSGPGRPRMASLVPPVHIAVLERTAIFRSLSDWARGHAHSVADSANLVFITGPSRTADIEQELTLGVHGPKDVHVVIV